MRHVSIRTLMALIVVSAVGLAALRNADELWAGMMLLLTLAMLGVAVLGGVFSPGEERAWWAGRLPSGSGGGGSGPRRPGARNACETPGRGAEASRPKTRPDPT